MAAKLLKTSKLILKLLITAILAFSIYYLLEGFSAILVTTPILASIAIPLLIFLIILGILSLLT